jgi:anti-anti-sigma factor
VIEITTSSPTAVTLTIDGDLDLVESSRFGDIVAEVTAATPDELVVDMCRVTFMDSSGAGFLIRLAEALRRRDARTTLRGIASRDEFVLDVCGALDSFTLDRDHHCTTVDQV